MRNDSHIFNFKDIIKIDIDVRTENNRYGIVQDDVEVHISNEYCQNRIKLEEIPNDNGKTYLYLIINNDCAPLPDDIFKNKSKNIIVICIDSVFNKLMTSINNKVNHYGGKVPSYLAFYMILTTSLYNHAAEMEIMTFHNIKTGIHGKLENFNKEKNKKFTECNIKSFDFIPDNDNIDF